MNVDMSAIPSSFIFTLAVGSREEALCEAQPAYNFTT